jgi:hypothetical protein
MFNEEADAFLVIFPNAFIFLFFSPSLAKERRNSLNVRKRSRKGGQRWKSNEGFEDDS